MVLSDFVSGQKHDDNNLHEIIPISFNMQSYAWSQAKSSGIKLPEVHGIGKHRSKYTARNASCKATAVTKVKEKSQIKPRLGQGRAGLRHEIKTQISKPLMLVKERTPLPNTCNIQHIAIPIPNFAIPQVKPKGHMSAKLIDRKTIQDVGREIPILSWSSLYAST